MSNIDPTTIVEDDPKKPWKAVVAAVIPFGTTFLAFWIADTDPFTAKEVGQGVLLGLAASGITGGATFATSNPKRVR